MCGTLLHVYWRIRYSNDTHRQAEPGLSFSPDDEHFATASGRGRGRRATFDHCMRHTFGQECPDQCDSHNTAADHI